MSISVGGDHHESHNDHNVHEEHHDDHDDHDDDHETHGSGGSSGSQNASGSSSSNEVHKTTAPDDDKDDDNDAVPQGGAGHSNESSYTPPSKPSMDLTGNGPARPDIKPTKPPETPPAANGMVGSNYVDLGKNQDGVMIDPMAAETPEAQQAAIDAMRTEIHNDLDRLQQDGIDTVRVFAQPPGGYSEADPEYFDKVTLRLQLVADEAQKMDPPMRVTVDLLDSHNAGGMAVYDQKEWGPQLDALTQNVVPNLKAFNNVDWSIGNEIKAPDQQKDFGTWYVNKADALHKVMGDGQRIIAELTPGAVNHPGFPPEQNPEAQNQTAYQAYQTMKQIAGASDVVSIHFYPPTAEQFLPDGIDNMNIRPQLDWQSLQAWQQAAGEVPNKPRFEIGEFSIPRDDYLQREIQQGLAHTPEEYNAIAQGWMERFEGMGVEKVSFWQYAKDETAGGGVDPSSWDHGDDTGATYTDGPRKGEKKEYLHVSDDQMRDLVRRWSVITP
jgi:hypothetical protein